MLAAPAFAADSNWHDSSFQPTSGGGCDWQCQDQGEAVITNAQINLGTIWSKTNADVSNISGDVNASATAVGNTVEVFTMQDTAVDNSQESSGQIGAEVNGNVDSVDGNVSLSATAVCNSADVSTDPNVTAVNNWQHCGAADPEATVNANVSNVTGGVGIAAMAIGNQLTADSNATHFPINNAQLNDGALIATATANVTNAGPVDLSSSAIGNTAQIIHYSTH